MIRAEEHDGLVHLRMARGVAGRALYWTGAYLFDGWLLDCGPPATARAIAKALAHETLDGIVLTHHHEDHVGAVPMLASPRGLVPFAHTAAVPLLRDGFQQRPYGLASWGFCPRFEARPLGPTLRTRTATLQVIDTPGHSVDHVCLFEPERGWLFTGDLFLGEKLRYLRSDEDLTTLIASLDLAAALPARSVWCAHRGLVEGGVGTLKRKAEHLKELRGRVLDLMKTGLPEAEVARRAVGREGLMTWLTLGHFSKRNFVRSIAKDGGSRVES